MSTTLVLPPSPAQPQALLAEVATHALAPAMLATKELHVTKQSHARWRPTPVLLIQAQLINVMLHAEPCQAHTVPAYARVKMDSLESIATHAQLVSDSTALTAQHAISHKRTTKHRTMQFVWIKSVV